MSDVVGFLMAMLFFDLLVLFPLHLTGAGAKCADSSLEFFDCNKQENKNQLRGGKVSLGLISRQHCVLT
jgi:hypothetical protein